MVGSRKTAPPHSGGPPMSSRRACHQRPWVVHLENGEAPVAIRRTGASTVESAQASGFSGSTARLAMQGVAL